MQPHLNKKTYTAADITRYHNGGMPAAEMHALEKAALDDPFLSDAIDGYVHTKTPAKDVRFLKQQIQNRSRKAIPMHNKRRQVFLSAAAMVVLLAGFGWLAYKISNNTGQDMAVQTEAIPQYKQAPAPQSSVADSAGTATDEATAIMPKVDQKKAEQITEEKANSNNADENKTTTIANEIAVNNKSIVADSQTFSKPQSAAPTGKAENDLAALRVPEAVFKARVVDVYNKAVPFATVTDAKNKTVAVTDTAGNFSIAAPDSSLTIAINSVGYQLQRTTLNRSDAETKIVLQQGSGQLNDVVVITKNRKQASRNKVRLEAVEPLEGWRSFNTFVDQNLVAPEELDERSGTKEVLLSFDVDKSGKAINVLVEKPLCATCDSTAVHIIREGSKWKKTRGTNKAKARVRF